MAQNRLLFTRSLAGFLGSLGKFLIALTIDNLSLGICLALHGASAKKHKVLLPGAFGNVERKQNLRGSRAVERSGDARAWSTKSTAARLMALEAGSLYLSSRHRGKGRHHVCRSKPCSSQPDGAVASRGMVLEGFCRQNPAPARGKR